jgi:hypothetical protein
MSQIHAVYCELPNIAWLVTDHGSRVKSSGELSTFKSPHIPSTSVEISWYVPISYTDISHGIF